MRNDSPTKTDMTYHPSDEKAEQYIYRICAMKEQSGMTWQQIADVLNSNLNNNYNESAYRKKFQQFNSMLNANRDKFVDSDSQLDEINEQLRSLEKERKKLQTEKIEYNKWLRDDARNDLMLEKYIQAVQELQPLKIPQIITPTPCPKCFMLNFGDEHFGTEFEVNDLFGNILFQYSPEIFESRMWNLFGQVVDFIREENIDYLYINDLGDYMDGILRASQLMKLRYGVVEATIRFADFISNWLNELTTYVFVDFSMTNGNHSELRMIGQPKGTFPDDNAGKVVSEFIKVRLQNNPNFKFTENPTGYIFRQTLGWNTLGIHGEVKNLNTAIGEFSQIYHVDINYIIAGHFHHSSSNEVQKGYQAIGVPSIIGVDDYSLSLHKTSYAAAKMLEITESHGIVDERYFKLD